MNKLTKYKTLAELLKHLEGNKKPPVSAPMSDSETVRLREVSLLVSGNAELIKTIDDLVTILTALTTDQQRLSIMCNPYSYQIKPFNDLLRVCQTFTDDDRVCQSELIHRHLDKIRDQYRLDSSATLKLTSILKPVKISELETMLWLNILLNTIPDRAEDTIIYGKKQTFSNNSLKQALRKVYFKASEAIRKTVKQQNQQLKNMPLPSLQSAEKKPVNSHCHTPLSKGPGQSKLGAKPANFNPKSKTTPASELDSPSPFALAPSSRH